jgi:carbon catabolite-derepressing protein kinase
MERRQQSPPSPPPSPPSRIILGKYQLTKFLGRGNFAKVYQARSLIDGSTVAVKVIDKSKTVDASMEPRIVREIDAMRRLQNHQNILKIHEVLATKTKIYLIVDFAGGGELFNKLSRRGRFPESLARRYFQQLVSALCFCHKNGVAHRDLKPQNLLLDADGNLKVSDFGLSALPEQLKNGLLHTACGTPAYTAPEILGRIGYDGSKADAWSCGVILYVLLAGHLPFDDSNIPAMCKRITRRDYQFPAWISKPARYLIYQLLDPNPKTRIRLENVIGNTWFKKSLREEPEEKVFESDLYNKYCCDSKKVEFGMNAFDIISMSSGLDLSGLFETASIRSEKRFTSSEQVVVVEEKVKEIGVRLGFRVEIGKNGTIGLGKGKVTMVVEVFKIVDDLLLVALKLESGGLEFEDLHWNDWKIGLQDVVLSWHNHESNLKICNVGDF